MCLPCSSNCSECNPITSECTICIEHYYLDAGKCLSCYYEPDAMIHFLDICFTHFQQGSIQNALKFSQFMAIVLN